ncbi:hypothetical protein AHAS_Ahas14G0243000 [Arachis hypogaea]
MPTAHLQITHKCLRMHVQELIVMLMMMLQALVHVLEQITSSLFAPHNPHKS